ncbi:MAG: MHS family MFS transporter [Gemmatimonadaceae bacterium]|nr:MHS family MFS transporter [Gemmatimonadaceae bacterium]
MAERSVTSPVQAGSRAGVGGTPDELDAKTIRQVVMASSAGTVIEWYDFYVFGTLAPILAPLFFPSSSETAAFLNTLATFGAGFAVRPLGALVFGRIGDMVGRKYAFMVTLLIMGAATACIGLLPTVSSVGIAAPIMLVLLRLLQGLALGGEYGGAAIYVAEHAPAHRRGYFTSFIQATATLGLLVSLIVILGTRAVIGEEAFKAWGWRVPFLLSALLVVMSYYIRRRMQESPVFQKMKEEGTVSRMPIREAFGTVERWKIFLSVLFGVVAGQAVVFYTGQFFALFFIQKVLKLSLTDSYVTVAIGIVLGTPFYLLSGAVSDRIGRKRMIVGGLFLAALTLYPIYRGMMWAGGPVTGEGATAVALHPNILVLSLLVAVQVFLVTLSYGPMAAFLVETYPARIRYTSMSLPYHLGNGWFGGFTPLIAASMVAAYQSPFAGLVYPIAVCVIGGIIGLIFVREPDAARANDTG